MPASFPQSLPVKAKTRKGPWDDFVSITVTQMLSDKENPLTVISQNRDSQLTKEVYRDILYTDTLWAL